MIYLSHKPLVIPLDDVAACETAGVVFKSTLVTLASGRTLLFRGACGEAVHRTWSERA